MNNAQETPQPIGFTVRLLATGADTAAVVDAWKQLSHWNLNDIRNMFKSAPINLMSHLAPEQAAAIKKALEAAGASVAINPTPS